MQNYFYKLSDLLCTKLRSSEVLLINLAGEISDFVRFNKAKIRQAGFVQQANISLDLIQGEHHSTLDYELQYNVHADLSTLTNLLDVLREQINHVTADPHLLYATTIHNTEHVDNNNALDSVAIVDDICRLSDGLDLVGLLASGQMFYGFANSLGQRNWHTTSSFHIDWSLHLPNNLAVKSSYAGRNWSTTAFQNHIEHMRSDLAMLTVPQIMLKPGIYPVYLAPTAVYELLDLLSDGFELKAHRSSDTPLLRMTRDGRKLNPKINLLEHPAAGLSPLFTDMGFIRPPQVALIQAGAYKNCLVGPRSAKEFAVPTTGNEMPDALDLASGNLPLKQVLETLGRGLWINNLWYCNISDPYDCRITGMTRFASFWVDGGEIRAPIAPLRFDDSLYRILGDKLIDLTQERSLLINADTYDGRSSACANLPGALIGEMRFTL